MYKLKKHQNFTFEIIYKSRTSLGAVICLILKEGHDFPSRSAFFRYVLEQSNKCSKRTFLDTWQLAYNTW